MDENNKMNDDINNIISSFEKRTQQIAEEQRESRERFVVALSELSRQYDLLREWIEKNNNELKEFLGKLGEPKKDVELLDAVKTITEKMDSLPQESQNIAKSIENRLETLLEKLGEPKKDVELLDAVKTITEKMDSLPQESQNIARMIDTSNSTTRNFLEQLSGLRSLSLDTKNSLLSFFATFKESVEKLANAISETKVDPTAKMDEISKIIFDKIDNFIATLKEMLSGIDNKTRPLFEKMEKSQLEYTEKQTSLLEAFEKQIQTLNTGLPAIQDGMKQIIENSVILSKKQDVTSAVIDKRGEGIGEKIGSVDKSLKEIKKANSTKKDEIKTAISELSNNIEKHIKSFDKILQENNNNRKAEAEKIVENLSQLPDEMHKYLDSNNEIVKSIKDVQSNIVNISKSIESMVKTITSKEKLREEKDKLENARNHLSRGVTLFYRHSLGAAEKEIRKAIELNDSFAEAYLNLGMVLGEMGKSDEAVKNIKKSLEIDPGLDEAYNNLGVIRLKEQKYEEAAAAFNQAIKIGHKYPQLYINIAKSLIGLDKIDEAIKSLKKAIEIDPTNIEVQELLSKYQKSNHKEEK